MINHRVDIQELKVLNPSPERSGNPPPAYRRAGIPPLLKGGKGGLLVFMIREKRRAMRNLQGKDK